MCEYSYYKRKEGQREVKRREKETRREREREGEGERGVRGVARMRDPFAFEYLASPDVAPQFMAERKR